MEEGPMREYLMARTLAASLDTGATGGDLDDEEDIIRPDGASSREPRELFSFSFFALGTC